MRLFFASAWLLLFFGVVLPLGAGFHFAGKDSRLRIKDPGARLVLNASILDFQGTLEITDSITTQLVGESIIFSSGIVERDGASATWTGRFDSAANGRFMLQGSSQMRAQPGMLFDGLHVSGQDNLVEGTPKFSAPIVLENTLSQLKFSIQNKLNHDVHLNGGRVTLEDTLSIGDDVMMHGQGIIDINSHTLNFPGKASTWGGVLHFLSATDMTLNAHLTLTGAWYFGPDNSLAVLQGNGNVLDMSNGGSLVVQAGVGLGLTDVIIKGLSETQGTIVMCDSNSTLSLSNAVLQLAGNYTFTQGNLYFYGANSMIVTGSNVLTINNIATIDATTLEYDTLSLPDTHPIVPNIPDGVNLITVNNGRLMTRPSGTSYGFVLYMDNPCYTQVRDESFDSINRALNFRGNNASNLTWDGAGFAMQFARGAALSNSLVVAAGKTVTLQNVVLKDFSSSAVSLGAGASLVFGNGVTIQLGANEALTMTWSFTGQAAASTIYGNGKNLSLASLSGGNTVGISVGAGEGAGSPVSLNIEDVHLQGLSGGVALDTLVADNYTYSTASAYVASSNRLRCVDYTGIINLRNVDLNLAGNYTLSAGNINIYNDVAIRGHGYTFAFSSNGTLAIKSGSTLLVDRNVTLSYDSSGLGALGLAASKNQLTMEDSTARLYLNGCTLYGTVTSPALQNGIVVVSDKVTFSSEGVLDSEALTLNTTSGLLVEVLSGAMLDVYGALAHQ